MNGGRGNKVTSHKYTQVHPGHHCTKYLSSATRMLVIVCFECKAEMLRLIFPGIC